MTSSAIHAEDFAGYQKGIAICRKAMDTLPETFRVKLLQLLASPMTGLPEAVQLEARQALGAPRPSAHPAA